MQVPRWVKFGQNNRFQICHRQDKSFIKDTDTDLVFLFPLPNLNVSYDALEQKCLSFFSLYHLVDNTSRHFLDDTFDYTEFNRMYDELASFMSN